MEQRLYKMDNIKCILIFFVVFGHLLEYVNGTCANVIYKFIYTFHMPVFIFITGYFAKFNKKKILCNVVFPYMIFQILYILFELFVIGNPVEITFLRPYWVLWYLFVIMLYFYFVIPVINIKNRKYKIFIILGSLMLALIAGVCDNIGYFMSLSRFFSFLPFL